MADKRRFDLFAELLRARFPRAMRVFDVAGRQLDDVRFDKNEIPAGQFSVKSKGLRSLTKWSSAMQLPKKRWKQPI